MLPLAFLLEHQNTRELLIEAHNFVYAGFALLLFGAFKAFFGRKLPRERSYWLWILLGGGVCLVALGIWVGEDQLGYMELFGPI